MKRLAFVLILPFVGIGLSPAPAAPKAEAICRSCHRPSKSLDPIQVRLIRYSDLAAPHPKSVERTIDSGPPALDPTVWTIGGQERTDRLCPECVNKMRLVIERAMKPFVGPIETPS